MYFPGRPGYLSFTVKIRQYLINIRYQAEVVETKFAEFCYSTFVSFLNIFQFSSQIANRMGYARRNGMKVGLPISSDIKTKLSLVKGALILSVILVINICETVFVNYLCELNYSVYAF